MRRRTGLPRRRQPGATARCPSASRTAARPTTARAARPTCTSRFRRPSIRSRSSIRWPPKRRASFARARSCRFAEARRGAPMPASVLVEGTRFKEGLERRLRAQPRLDRLTRRRGQLCSRVYRQLSAVKAELGWAFDLAERLEVTVAETETLTCGRIFGPTLSAGCGLRGDAPRGGGVERPRHPCARAGVARGAENRAR